MRRLFVPAVLLATAAVIALAAGPAVLQWWSMRWSSAPLVARAALECETGRGHVVTAVEERPWGWVVRVEDWRVAYLGADDTSSGAPATYVIKVGDSDTREAWYGGSSPPTDPATGRPLTAAGAQDPWEADMVLALQTGMARQPYSLQRCADRQP